MRAQIQLALLAAVLIIPASGARAGVITFTVDPSLSISSTNFHTISAAVNAESAGNTYTISVAPSTYLNDFPVINQPTDIEATGQGVILRATATNDQGIITTFANLTVNGLTITGALASDPNSSAAAIRDHNDGGANANTLIVKNSRIENSQNGIQTSSASGTVYQEHVTIDTVSFVGNGGPIGPAHALYIRDAAAPAHHKNNVLGTRRAHGV